MLYSPVLCVGRFMPRPAAIDETCSTRGPSNRYGVLRCHCAAPGGSRCRVRAPHHTARAAPGPLRVCARTWCDMRFAAHAIGRACTERRRDVQGDAARQRKKRDGRTSTSTRRATVRNSSSPLAPSSARVNLRWRTLLVSWALRCVGTWGAPHTRNAAFTTISYSCRCAAKHSRRKRR